MKIKAWKVGALLALGLPLSAQAGFVADTVVNIDFNNGTSDPTYASDDGLFSSVGGTTWNGIDDTATSAVALLNEYGDASPVQFLFTTDTPGFGDDPDAANDLQIGGLDLGSFAVYGLDSSKSYDVVFYLGSNSGIYQVVDAFGGHIVQVFGSQTNESTLVNNVAGVDYQTLTLFPFDLFSDIGTHSYGFEITAIDGLLQGLQIDNIPAAPEPASLALLGLGSVLVLRRRR